MGDGDRQRQATEDVPQEGGAKNSVKFPVVQYGLLLAEAEFL
jgi:hypothetical protein